MAKKEKRISINALEKVMKEQFAEATTVEWCGIEVTIKHTLPLQEMLLFVKEVVDSCFMDDGTYVPEVMDFAIKSGILTHYANFTLPDNLEKQYWLIYNSGAAEMVCESINKVQLQEMVNGINRKIEHMCDTDITEMRAKIEALSEAFANLGEQFIETLGDISGDDIQKLTTALSAGGVREDKIVAAYIDQMKKGSTDDK